MTRAPLFPPLLHGLASGPADPFPIACTEAAKGTDSGLIVWSLDEERLRAAIVLAPETPLSGAIAAFRACAMALRDAFGNLAPPETSMQFDWAGGVRVNAGHCGGLKIAASTRDPEVVPDWIVVGFELTVTLPPEWEPGETPDWTALVEEGCGEIDPIELLEYWSRHVLRWLNALDEPGGRRTLHREWQAYAWKHGEALTLPLDGQRIEATYLGDDDHFGMLLKLPNGTTRLIPLISLVEADQ